MTTLTSGAGMAGRKDASSESDEAHLRNRFLRHYWCIFVRREFKKGPQAGVRPFLAILTHHPPMERHSLNLPGPEAPPSSPDAGPLVSVIVTCFNSREPLIEALRSACEQTWVRKEIIVVDDGSRPDRAEFIDSIVQTIPGAQLVRIANSGPSGALNQGVRISRGEFLAFLDHDDVWQPTYLETIMAAFPHLPRAASVFCRIEIVGPNLERTGRVTRPQMRGFRAQDILFGDPAGCGSSFVVRRQAFEAIGGFNVAFRCAQLPDLFIRFLLAGWDLEGINQILVLYRNLPTGLCHEGERMKYRMRDLNTILVERPELGRGRWLRCRIVLNHLRVRLRRWRYR